MNCSAPDCGLPRYGTTSSCYDHYLTRPRCEVDDCHRLPGKRGSRCTNHREVQIAGPAKKCEFEACDRRGTARGLCSAHAKQRRKGKPLVALRARIPGLLCSFDGCGRPVCSGGLCSTHNDQRRAGRELAPIIGDRRRPKRPLPTCLFEPCDRRARGHAGVNAYCAGHYAQLSTGQDLRSLGRTRQGYINPDGYRLIYVGGEPIMEHRAVMQQMLGRPLERYENVHHKNGDRADNRPENLELWVNKQPRGQRVDDLISFVLDHYRPQLMRRLEQELEP